MSSSDLLLDYRAAHAALAEVAPLPSFKHGLNIQIRPKSFDFDLLQSTPAEVAVSHNAPDGVVIKSLSDLSDPSIRPESVQPFFGDDWENAEDQHRLYHQHQAWANHFLLIRLPRDKVFPDPIEITLTTKQVPLFSTILIRAEAGTQAKIVVHKSWEVSEDNASPYWSEDVRVLSGANSQVEFIGVQQLPDHVVHSQRRSARTESDARIHWLELCLGSHYTRYDVASHLAGQGSSTDNTVLFLASGEQRFSIYTESDHISPSTYSNIVTKGVIGDRAKALSRGLVKIGQQAAGSSGYEQQDALLLSDKAEADAIPNLEIHNHDVKCSHGSTVGQVDAEVLFYLMSRGLSEQQAKQQVVEGYFAPALEVIGSDLVRENVLSAVRKAVG